jgi:hypothetical protein
MFFGTQVVGVRTRCVFATKGMLLIVGRIATIEVQRSTDQASRDCL